MRTFLRDAFRYGGIVRYRFGERTGYMISDPELIRQMLVGHRTKYVKSNRYDVLLPILGRGLLLSEGQDWRRQNSRARPAFRLPATREHWERMTRAVSERLDRWPAWVASGDVVDIEAEMTRLTQGIVGPWTMGAVYWTYAEDFARHLDTMRHYLADPARGVWSLLPTKRNRGFRSAVAGLDRMFYEVVREVRKRESDDSFLALYLQAYAEAGGTVEDRELRDQAATVFIPGHETSSSTLAWLWYVLSTVTGIYKRLKAEVDHVIGTRVPTPEEVAKLDYTRRAVQEVLRLYSPACSFSRTAVVDDEIGGYWIAGGSQVIVCAYATHRLPHYWEDPEQFNPDRFLPEEVEKRPAWTYYPFGLGQRACIGAEFGLLQVTLIAAMTVQRYRIDLMPGQPIENEYNVVLRPKGGMKVTIRNAGEAASGAASKSNEPLEAKEVV